MTHESSLRFKLWNPRLRVFLTLSFLAWTTGCGCIETPGDRLERMRVEDELPDQLQVQSRTPEEAAPAETDASQWDREQWRSRLEDLYRYLDRDRCGEVLADGNRVLAYRPPESVVLEIHILLARCFEKIGDLARAREHRDLFLAGYRKLIESDEFKKQGVISERLHEGLKRLKERAGRDIFQVTGESARVNVGLAKRLADAAPQEILKDNLPDGATIYYCQDPQALEDDLTGPEGPRLAIQRDPEFGYYFAIEEPEPAGL